MSKARMLSALMLVCLLVLGICSWAGAEEVIIVDKALTERVAVPADQPIISGAISPETGISSESDSNMYSSVQMGSATSNLMPAARKVLFNLKLTF